TGFHDTLLLPILRLLKARFPEPLLTNASSATHRLQILSGLWRTAGLAGASVRRARQRHVGSRALPPPPALLSDSALRTEGQTASYKGWVVGPTRCPGVSLRCTPGCRVGALSALKRRPERGARWS